MMHGQTQIMIIIYWTQNQFLKTANINPPPNKHDLELITMDHSSVY